MPIRQNEQLQNPTLMTKTPVVAIRRNSTYINKVNYVFYPKVYNHTHEASIVAMSFDELMRNFLRFQQSENKAQINAFLYMVSSDKECLPRQACLSLYVL